MDVQELIAREQIRDVKARYCRMLDTKDWEGFAALFTKDVILDVSQDTGAPRITAATPSSPPCDGP